MLSLAYFKNRNKKATSKKGYASAEPDENLRYRDFYNHFTAVRSQLQIAGIRLAKVLNDLF